MFRFLLRLSLGACVVAALAVVTARLVGKERPRDYLAFVVGVNGDSDIYIADVPLGIIANLVDFFPADSPYVNSECGETMPAWSSDGRLAFEQQWCRSSFSIMTFDFTTQQLSLVTDNGITLAWSKDGRIAYGVVGASQPSELIIFDPQTGEHVPAAPGLRYLSISGTTPVWSSDGRLAFVATASVLSQASIYVRDAQGVVTNVTPYQPGSYLPAWSDDGLLAYQTSGMVGMEVYVVDPATLEVIQVTDQPDMTGSNPTWLPDGRLSFVRWQGDHQEFYALDLHMEAPVNPTRIPFEVGAPFRSQSGLVAFAGGPNRRALYVMNPATGTIANLSGKQLLTGGVAWAR